MLRLSALLAGVLLAGGLIAGCQATAGTGGCRAAAAGTLEIAPKPKPKPKRKPACTKANSPVWQGFKPYRGDIKTNGRSGSGLRFYRWDYTHGDIEVFDKNGKHLGSMDPSSGAMTKPAVPGRRIDV